jgi:hypothetical protein
MSKPNDFRPTIPNRRRRHFRLHPSRFTEAPMITEPLFNAIAAISKLSFEEQMELFRFFQSKPPAEPMVVAVAKPAKPEPKPKGEWKGGRIWTDDETLGLLDLMERYDGMNPKQRRLSVQRFARSIGRTVKAIQIRMSEIRTENAK